MKSKIRAVYIVPGRKSAPQKPATSEQRAINAAPPGAEVIGVQITPKIKKVSGGAILASYSRVEMGNPQTDVGGVKEVCFRQEQTIQSGPNKGKHRILCKKAVAKTPKAPKWSTGPSYGQAPRYSAKVSKKAPGFGVGRAFSDYESMGGAESSPLLASLRAQAAAQFPAARKSKSKRRDR